MTNQDAKKHPVPTAQNLQMTKSELIHKYAPELGVTVTDLSDLPGYVPLKNE